MAHYRRRFRIIDHEKNNVEEVGPTFVLIPAKNPADLAAMHTLIQNVDPELAAQLQVHVDMIEAHPNRTLGSYGEECLPYVSHPKVVPFAQARLAKMRADKEKST
jgi:hypothetical protein